MQGEGLPKIISFIGWHNSGKTTLASEVAAECIAKGISVGVIKSTKESIAEITANSPADRRKDGLATTDTAHYCLTGADVLLAASDAIILQKRMVKPSLQELAKCYFADKDLVIGEGFKYEVGVDKIEIYCGGELLAGEVVGVCAVVMREELPPAVQRRLEGNGVRLFSVSDGSPQASAATIAQYLGKQFALY